MVEEGRPGVRRGKVGWRWRGTGAWGGRGGQRAPKSIDTA